MRDNEGLPVKAGDILPAVWLTYSGLCWDACLCCIVKGEGEQLVVKREDDQLIVKQSCERFHSRL